jgi:hypothetical protein
MNCSTNRRLIDEANNPAHLPYEVASHIEACRACREFAGEREQLRKLLLEPARVAAPSNFEAVVARRLAGRRAQTRPFWAATGFYLRAAGAAAALACAVLVIQVVRVRSVSTPTGDNLHFEAPLIPDLNAQQGTSPPKWTTPAGIGVVAVIKPVRNWGPRPLRPTNTDATPLEAVSRDLMEQPRALLLIRNSGSEREVAVPMISVGAQPWLSVSFQDERGVRAAF